METAQPLQAACLHGETVLLYIQYEPLLSTHVLCLSPRTTEGPGSVFSQTSLHVQEGCRFPLPPASFPLSRLNKTSSLNLTSQDKRSGSQTSLVTLL